MGDAKALLKQWMLQFIKSRDAFFKRIAFIENPVQNADFMVTHKDGRQHFYIILPSLENVQQALAPFRYEQHIAIVTLNNRQNRQKLTELWNFLVQFKLLTIYFVNPFSNGEKKWVLMPHMHAKVCDDASLTTGFNSLSELVGDISEEEVAARTS
jgi:hypothetical protein